MKCRLEHDICVWNLCVSIHSCKYSNLCMCHHRSVCSCVCTDWSFPKDIPFALTTRPSRWHQMVITKENLVHPHPLFSVWHTHTHLREEQRVLLYRKQVCLCICLFVISDVNLQFWMFGATVLSTRTDNWIKINVFFPTNELITYLLVIVTYRLDQDLT